MNNRRDNKPIVQSISFAADLTEFIENYKETNPRGLSKFISDCVREKLRGGQIDIIERRIAEIEREIFEGETRLTALRREKAELESRLREHSRNQNKATEQRLLLLERAVRQKWLDDPERYNAWATGPAGIDTLADCNFRSPDEALAWIRANTHLMEM